MFSQGRVFLSVQADSGNRQFCSDFKLELNTNGAFDIVSVSHTFEVYVVTMLEYNIGVTSNNMTSLLCSVKVGEFIQHLVVEDTCQHLALSYKAAFILETSNEMKV
jgi:hypothetical protein